jgi:hypothetical protein
MLDLLFYVLMFVIFGRIAFFAVKLAWGFTKVLVYLIFLPFILFIAIISGFISWALPILVIIGILSLIFVR